MQPNDGRVVSNFILQALSNKNITIYGEGNQTRSFCYVDDLISGIMLMMEKKKILLVQSTLETLQKFQSNNLLQK